jgi:NAD(P)-dependent dehydrogenase (short-subunit alcohol dehydrogenase family)
MTAPDAAPAPRLARVRCLVTGGSRGLGRALCLALGRAGARVAFTYQRRTADAEEARAALERLGAETRVFQGSVADGAHARRVVDEMVAAWGGVDVLINNAAIFRPHPTVLTEEEDWDGVMDVNVKGAYLFSRACLAPMLRAGAGHILNIGVFAVDRVSELPVPFAASKGALLAMTRALAREVGRYGIRVNALSPGLCDDGMGARLHAARRADYQRLASMGRLGTFDEIAAFAVWLVSPENTFMAGANVTVDGGL